MTAEQVARIVKHAFFLGRESVEAVAVDLV
jgi:hypothetical protein